MFFYRFGRRPTLIISVAIGAVTALVLAFSPNYTMYLCLRFLLGTSSMAMSTICFVQSKLWIFFHLGLKFIYFHQKHEQSIK